MSETAEEKLARARELARKLRDIPGPEWTWEQCDLLDELCITLGVVTEDGDDPCQIDSQASLGAGGHAFHTCNDERCQVCLGGLLQCTCCGGAEASLPTECPNRRMTVGEADDVVDRKIDFKGGRWIDLAVAAPGAGASDRGTP